jgi:hypothetical protein
VSSYSRIYNLLWFNNGYHAEHHYRPRLHWTRMEALRREISDQQRRAGTRVIAPPHALGFLDSGQSGRVRRRLARENRFRVRCVLWGLIVAMIAYAVWGTCSALAHERYKDFWEFFLAAQEMHRGGDIYAAGKDGYIYPPLLAFLLMPLVPLGLHQGRLELLDHELGGACDERGRAERDDDRTAGGHRRGPGRDRVVDLPGGGRGAPGAGGSGADRADARVCRTTGCRRTTS